MKLYASGILVVNFLLVSACFSQPSVAVFCSADNKASSDFKALAYNLGKQLGEHNFGLVTGGSKTGLMKEVVDGYTSIAKSKKTLYGVMPQVLYPYNVHHEEILPENLLWVDTLHIRLARFAELADTIVILPGGFGTLHELMDFLAHNQFALTSKPIIVINYKGYWDNLLAQFNVMNEAQLLADKHLKALHVVDSDDACIKTLINNAGSNQQGLSDHYWN
ncbi:LOG family protein YvdD [Candidatus Dependentiae bacterium Noda2021]|nr:LOG family protein YvdD [Candidatus Dependentiae bacterium Noda2021]